jgi:hypothetical protein
MFFLTLIFLFHTLDDIFERHNLGQIQGLYKCGLLYLEFFKIVIDLFSHFSGLCMI